MLSAAYQAGLGLKSEKPLEHLLTLSKERSVDFCGIVPCSYKEFSCSQRQIATRPENNVSSACLWLYRQGHSFSKAAAKEKRQGVESLCHMWTSIKMGLERGRLTYHSTAAMVCVSTTLTSAYCQRLWKRCRDQWSCVAS